MTDLRLPSGVITVIDDEDYERVSAGHWHIAGRRLQHVSGRVDGRRIYLHRFILKAPVGVLVDHRDGDGLNNRKTNLRLCSLSLNGANARHRGGTSRFKGVMRLGDQSWMAQITVDCHHRYLGVFALEEDAARAYDAAAIAAWGDFARPNFPQALTA